MTYYTNKQASQLLGVPYHNLYHYVRMGLIKPKRIAHVVLWTDAEIERMRKHYADLKAKRGKI
jgi:DNA-binding transcriptional MerR regulator